MGQVHWAESALDDMKDILEFVRKDSPAYADRLAVRLTAATRSLASFPRLGRIVPEIQEDLRDGGRAELIGICRFSQPGSPIRMNAAQ